MKGTDPRSEEEKARAALKRNEEMGQAPHESPLTRNPSVTPATFGDKEREAMRQRDQERIAGACDRQS